MNLSIYGAGYVGLVSAVCFAKLGHNVICTDILLSKIENLRLGICPIHEEDLPLLLNEMQTSHKLSFTADINEAIAASNIHFIATGTPSLNSGDADLSQVLDVARQIATFTNNDCIIVTKSTVPVGTGDVIEALVNEILITRGVNFKIGVVSNPEFLQEGRAVRDFLSAHRIILGGEEESLATIKDIYKPLALKNIPILSMSRQSAELTKYAANAMLASRISFINQIAQFAEKVEANIDEVSLGIGLDPRIGLDFLKAGIGFGGSCFPKDLKALKKGGIYHNIDVSMLDAIEKINKLQKQWVFLKILKHFNNLQNLKIAIWGLAFKPGTDDLREASSISIIDELLKYEVNLYLYDPVALKNAKAYFGENPRISWCDNINDVFNVKLDTLVIASEWDEFKNYPLKRLAHNLQNAVVFDGRNCFNLSAVSLSPIKYYYSVGRPCLRKE